MSCSVHFSGSHIDRKASSRETESIEFISVHSDTLLVRLEVQAQIHLNTEKGKV